jgi:hypothetical protein
MPFQTNPDLYIQEETERISKYYDTNKLKLAGFEGRDNFINWYLHELSFNECRCHYCNTNILHIRQLLNAGLINGRSVRGTGLRGPNFELDRKDPEAGYNERNCVLSCYYCNNDKSNTFSYETYLNIIGPAKGAAWNTLLNNIH